MEHRREYRGVAVGIGPINLSPRGRVDGFGADRGMPSFEEFTGELQAKFVSDVNVEQAV